MSFRVIDPLTSGLPLGQVFDSLAELSEALSDGTKVGTMDSVLPSTCVADTAGRSIFSKEGGIVDAVVYPKGPSPEDIAWVRNRHMMVAREARQVLKDARKMFKL